MGAIDIPDKFDVHENATKVNIVNPYRHENEGNPQASYLADVHPTTASGWFPFRISFAFDKCLRLRRSSDNAETDVLTDVNPSTYISLSSMTSAGVSLGAWIGSDDGFVRTAYDMTGNGYDYIQTNTLKQPKFINSGVIITDPGSGKPAIYGQVGQDLTAIIIPFPASGDISISAFTKGRSLTITANYGLFGIQPKFDNLGDRRAFYLSDESSQRGIRYFGGNTIFDTAFANVATIQKSIFKSPNVYPTYYENGVQRTRTGGSAAQDLAIQSDSAFRLFAGAGDGFDTDYDAPGNVEGYISGVIWYFQNKEADRAAIENFIQH